MSLIDDVRIFMAKHGDMTYLAEQLARAMKEEDVAGIRAALVEMKANGEVVTCVTMRPGKPDEDAYRICAGRCLKLGAQTVNAKTRPMLPVITQDTPLRIPNPMRNGHMRPLPDPPTPGPIAAEPGKDWEKVIEQIVPAFISKRFQPNTGEAIMKPKGTQTIVVEALKTAATSMEFDALMAATGLTSNQLSNAIFNAKKLGRIIKKGDAISLAGTDGKAVRKNAEPKSTVRKTISAAKRSKVKAPSKPTRVAQVRGQLLSLAMSKAGEAADKATQSISQLICGATVRDIPRIIHKAAGGMIVAEGSRIIADLTPDHIAAIVAEL